MAGWLKDFDPLKNARVLDTGLSSSTDGLAVGWKIATALSRMIATVRARSQQERERTEEKQRQEDLLRAPPPLHGSAGWATADELHAAGLLRPMSAFDTPSSLLIGALPGTDVTDPMQGHIHWDGEGHLLTVAPTRSGKSTTTIVPNLLRYRGSCVVLDPKGELYRETSAWRAANVGPVYRIAPFAETTHTFNPLMTLRQPSDVRALAELIVPDDPKASEFFKKDAVAFLVGLMWFVARTAPPARRNLAEVRTLTSTSLPRFREFVERLAGSDDPTIANPAQIVLSKDPEKAVRTLRDTLSSELSFFDDPGIRAAVSGNDVDFRSLKDTPATIYISVPFHKMGAFAPFLKILLTTALEAMVENERQPDIPVLFVLDEFLSLKSFPKFRDAIRTHAGAGVRLWFFLQDVSTLQEYYPQGWQAFFNASVKQFFGTDEAFTGRLVSEWLGDSTVAYQSSSLSMGRSAPAGPPFNGGASQSTTINESVTLTRRPLLTPDEVVRLLSGPLPDQTRHGLTFLRGVHPIRARLVPWFLGETCKQRVGTISSPPRL